MNFEQIYNEYRDKVFRLSLGYTNNYEIAQDITQETFISVWKNLSNFRNESSIGTWIYRIATNSCLKQIEGQKRLKINDLPINLSEEKDNDIEFKIQLLYEYISELPEIDRIIISLELEDIKQIEIAQIVGLSEVNIRVKIHRIKTQLAKRFRENGE